MTWRGAQVLWVGTLWLASFSLALRVTAPNSVAVATPSCLYSKHVGPSSVTSSMPPAAAVGMDVGEVCGTARNLTGRVAVLAATGSGFKQDSREAIHDAILCAEAKGAIAVVMPSPQGRIPGYIYYLTNSRFENRVTIPVVHVAGPDMTPAELRSRDYDDVVIELTIDENEWMTMWDSAEFSVVWLGLVLGVNAVGIVWAIRGLYLRYRYPSYDRYANRLMIAGLWAEFISCTIRLASCFLGPVFSSDVVLTWEHYTIIMIPIVIEFLTNLIAIELFVRWGAMSSLRDERKRKIIRIVEISLGMFYLAVPLFLVTIVYQQGMSALANGLMLTLGTVATMTTSLFFLVQGSRFIRRLNSAPMAGKAANGHSVTRQQAIHRAVRWIMYAGVAQLIQVVAMCCLMAGLFLYPDTGLAFYGLLALGSSVSALATSQAFAPANTAVARQANAPSSRSLSAQASAIWARGISALSNKNLNEDRSGTIAERQTGIVEEV